MPMPNWGRRSRRPHPHWSPCGVGTETAAQLLITAGDNADRLNSEASFAHVCAAAPIAASSGRTHRHRLNRGDGEVVVRSCIVEGMAHGTPVKPSEKCGTAGKNFLDTICSSSHITADWGLGG